MLPIGGGLGRPAGAGASFLPDRGGSPRGRAGWPLPPGRSPPGRTPRTGHCQPAAMLGCYHPGWLARVLARPERAERVAIARGRSTRRGRCSGARSAPPTDATRAATQTVDSTRLLMVWRAPMEHRGAGHVGCALRDATMRRGGTRIAPGVGGGDGRRSRAGWRRACRRRASGAVWWHRAQGCGGAVRPARTRTRGICGDARRLRCWRHWVADVAVLGWSAGMSVRAR